MAMLTVNSFEPNNAALWLAHLLFRRHPVWATTLSVFCPDYSAWWIGQKKETSACLCHISNLLGSEKYNKVQRGNNMDDLKLSWRLSTIKLSRATSHVKWLSQLVAWESFTENNIPPPSEAVRT
jgi:hypothetical protein